MVISIISEWECDNNSTFQILLLFHSQVDIWHVQPGLKFMSIPEAESVKSEYYYSPPSMME